jgi:hypothetical protein
VIIFLAKNRQMARQFSEKGIFCRKFPVFEKKIRQKATENWFLGDGVATFMPTNYSFFLEINLPVKSKSVKGCSPPWLQQEIGKKKTLLPAEDVKCQKAKLEKSKIIYQKRPAGIFSCLLALHLDFTLNSVIRNQGKYQCFRLVNL